MLIAATYRTDDIHRRHPLRPFLAETDRLRTVERHRAGPLQPRRGARQLAAIMAEAPRRPGRRRVRPLRRQPLLRRGAGLQPARRLLTGISDSLRDLLLVRVEALPEAAQRVREVRRRGRQHRRVPAAGRHHRARRGRPARRAAHRGRRQHPAADRQTATATASGTPWSARRSATTCCPASAAGSTAATPRPSRPTPPWSAPTSAPPGWPATGTPRTIRPRRCPPCCTPPSRPADRHAYAEQYRLLERALELWDTAPEDVRDALRPADYVEATSAAARSAPAARTGTPPAAASSTCWPRSPSPPGSAASANAPSR